MKRRRTLRIALYCVLALTSLAALAAIACSSEEAPAEEAAAPSASQAQAPAAPTSAPAPAPTETPVPLEATPVIATAVPAAPATMGDAKYGGTLRKSAGDDLVHFDFMVQTTVRTQQRVGAAYNRLFRYAFDEKGVILPDLAEEWDASGDGLTYNITLQDGIKFHTIEGVPGSGMGLDCQDSVHSLNKYRNVETSKRAKDVGAIASVECGSGSPGHRHQAEPARRRPHLDVGRGLGFSLPQRAPLRGPRDHRHRYRAFRLAGYTKGGKAELTKNPDYWRDGLPYMDGIEDIVFAEETASFAAFRAKQLDVNSSCSTSTPKRERYSRSRIPPSTSR